MGATDEQKHDVDYCVSAALVQLDDLEGDLREKALRALAAAVSVALNAEILAREGGVEGSSSQFVYRTAVAKLTVGLDVTGRLKKRDRAQVVACLRDYIKRLQKGNRC